MDEMIQKRKILPRIDRTIGYIRRRIKNTEKAMNMAADGGYSATAYFFTAMWYDFQEMIGKLKDRRTYLELVYGIGIKSPWKQCDSLIDEYEKYIQKQK